MDYNKAIVVGNLTRDPELKRLPSGDSVCNLSIATNRTWSKDGQKQQEVEYHNIVLFGKIADTVKQYMKKGSELLVEGRLKTSSWESDGVKKYKTEIVAENVRFGSKRDGGNQSESYARPERQSNENLPELQYGEDEERRMHESDEIDISDIPF